MDLAHSAAVILDRNNLVKYDRRSGNLQATHLGRIASQYYVSHRTISAFNEHLKPTMGEIELLRLFALAEEFKYMIVREVSGRRGWRWGRVGGQAGGWVGGRRGWRWVVRCGGSCGECQCLQHR
jgi:hypothetical protein